MDRDYERQTHQAEDRHWWYRGRRTVLKGAIAGLGLPEPARILDAGCGSGRNMVELARLGTVTGVELSETSVALARERDVGEVIAGLGAGDAVRRRQLRPGRQPGRDRAPRGRPRRAARAAPHGRPRRRAAGHRARLPVAVERPRRDQPPPPPLYPPLAAARRRAGRLAASCARPTSTRCCCPSRSCCGCSTASTGPRRPSRASTCGCPRSRVNWLLERPLTLEAALIARGGRIPAGLSLLAVFR